MSESEPTQIGDIIRQRRAELGLSPADLGELIGRTGSTVRRWEKNEATPPASLLPALATALDLDQGALKAALKSSSEVKSPPAREKEPEAQEPVAEAETKARQPSMKEPEPEAKADPPPINAPPPVQRPASTKPELSAPPMSEDRPPSAPGRSAPPAPNKQPPPQPVPPSGVGVLTASGTEAITELPTEVMAVPSPEPTAEPGVVSRPARTRTIQRPQEAALSYVEDPAQRYRYFLRWLLTAVAIVVMLFVLAWAFTELKEALGDVWDLFQEEPSETTIVGANLSGG